MQGVLDFTIKFVNTASSTTDSQVNTASAATSASVETFDPMLLLILGLFIAFVITFVVFSRTVLSKKNNIDSSANTVILKNRKMSILAMASVVFFAAFLIVFAINGNAVADQLTFGHNNPEAVNVDKNVLIANVDENGKITVENATISNDSDFDYMVKKVLIKPADDFALNNEVASSNVKITGCDGIIYNDTPNGNAYVPVSVNPILAKGAATLSFEISNIDAKSLIESLDGKDVYRVSLQLASANTVERYKVSVDLKNGNVKEESKIKLKTWTQDSEFVYSKYFTEGADTRDIMKEEWGDVGVEYPAHWFDLWEYNKYKLDGDANVWATWWAKDTLNDFTWPELKRVSDDLSKNEESSPFYKIMADIAKAGGMIEVPLAMLPGEIDPCEDYLYFRIIGICENDKADGSGKAGLTFMAVNSMERGHAYISQDGQITSYSQELTNWAKSGIRASLQDGGALYEKFPAEVKTVITKASVPYATAFGSSGSTGEYSSYIKYSADKMFLPSYTELGGETPEEHGVHLVKWAEEGKLYDYAACDPWYGYEGFYTVGNTPRLNNVNYHGFRRLYELRHSSPENSLFNRLFTFIKVGAYPIPAKDLDMDNGYVLTRTLCPEVMDQVITFNYEGRLQEYGTSITDKACIAPCFCL